MFRRTIGAAEQIRYDTGLPDWQNAGSGVRGVDAESECIPLGHRTFASSRYGCSRDTIDAINSPQARQIIFAYLSIGHAYHPHLLN